MKKLIISGSSKLYERALYWRGYFEGRGYDVIDWPTPVTDDPEEATTPPTPGFLRGRLLRHGDTGFDSQMIKIYQRYWRNLEDTDVFFLMNEDKNDIEGYIGAGAFSELTGVVIGNLIHGKNTEIYLLKSPNKSQSCYEEVKFWLDQKIIKIYEAPTGRKALVPISQEVKPQLSDADLAEPATDSVAEDSNDEESGDEDTESALDSAFSEPIADPAPRKRRGLFHSKDDKTIDLMHFKKKVLKNLSLTQREYLCALTDEFPAWLLDYIAAPEFQRLAGVTMTTMDYSSLNNFPGVSTVFSHSIGVALILWKFTHDKKQTLAGLFHDIASPSFKHAIDYFNGDSEKQESIEAETGRIIRDSRVIMRELKKDDISASEIQDYKLYPLADNDIPGLAADRLEYTFSNGYFLYETWTLSEVKKFFSDITIFENEDGLEEFGFKTPSLAAEWTKRNLELAANYHCPAARATLQFFADILGAMIKHNLLSLDDLYVMSEREVIDWILSCGNHEITDAFLAFQRSTSAYGAASPKKGTYNTTVRAKVRYIDPLVTDVNADSSASSRDTSSRGAHVDARDTDSSAVPARRISEVNPRVSNAIDKYLAAKQPRYVGFDFSFKPE